MSNIGMKEEVCTNDGFSLVVTEGSGLAEIFDDDGDHVLNVRAEEVGAAMQAFNTITAMYRQGFKDGTFNGRLVAQAEMRKAIGQ